MTYINKLDTFDEVAQWYAKTKPLVSVNHTLEQDVRPIGKRARKWERIIKVDDNTYALSCGGAVDPVFCWSSSDEASRVEFPITPEEIASLSPIVWRKHADGTETITIRNGVGEWQHNNIYSFIQRALPRKLWFRQTRIGKQFIHVLPTGTSVHLPKTRTVARHVYEYYKRMVAQGKDSWAIARYSQFSAGPDGLGVTFKREANGGFTLVGEAHKVMVDRTRVDKTTKATFKDHIEAVFQSAMGLYPMMRNQLNWGLKHQYATEMQDIATKHNIHFSRSYGNKGLFVLASVECRQAVFLDPEHPLRHYLHVDAMFAIRTGEYNFEYDPAQHEDDEAANKARSKHIRTAFNKWVNTAGGFANKVREEK